MSALRHIAELLQPRLWFSRAGRAASLHDLMTQVSCGIGSCGVPRLSLADYVMRTGTPRGATAAGVGRTRKLDRFQFQLGTRDST
jgi:hypothetical protein